MASQSLGHGARNRTYEQIARKNKNDDSMGPQKRVVWNRHRDPTIEKTRKTTKIPSRFVID
ncbi:hypothetical protein KIN20_032082 [Parelaphostrongylus tenuis]|uniref:Uncharacterized protein n=1 Tax=Parelaphostrongylus tenuis TaxID=148309 RepID=A0AAD5WI83_PARTN|nr:hypothetical protein KIN20_032082 [Parelaphostrongylus tenuis]